MAKLTVEMEVKERGGAMTELRKIADRINRGHMGGPGWSLEVEEEEPAQVGRNEPGDEEKGTDEETPDTGENDQPEGTQEATEDAVYVFTSPWQDRKTGEKVKKGELEEEVLHQLLVDGVVEPEGHEEKVKPWWGGK